LYKIITRNENKASYFVSSHMDIKED